MKTVIKKLKSECGASILLALLFFLVCSMVAASILMAAVSNAGKTRSSREEQQAYLTLTSAMQFVCDDLLGATYYGKYTYDPQPPEGENKGIKTYTQADGRFDCYLAEILINDFDDLFAKKAESQIETFDKTNGTYTHKFFKKNTAPPPPGGHVIKLCPEGDEWKDQEVRVTLEVLDSYSIELKAELGTEGEDRYYVIYAELTANESKPPELIEDPGISTQDTLTGGMTWKLGWITKTDDKREDAA